MKPLIGKKRSRALWALFVLALAARLGFLATQGVPETLGGDAAEYSAYAASFSERGVFMGSDGRRAARMPGYPAFLGALYLIFGPSTTAVLIVQCFIGALSVVLLFFLAEILLGTSWAWACGICAALYYDSIFSAASPLTECLYVALLTAAFWALYRGGPPMRRALHGGLLFGATYLVRPEAMAWGGLVLASSPWWAKRFSRKEAGVGLAAMLVVVFAWTARNWAVLGKPLPTSSMGGHLLYLGLEHPTEDLHLRPATRYTPPAGTPEIEMGKLYVDKFHALRRSLSYGELFKAYSYTLIVIYYPFLPQYDWTYAWLIPLWLFGMWLALRDPRWWPLAGFAPALTCVYLIFGGPSSRYRFGFAFVLILLAGLGARELHARWGRRRFSRRLGAWCALHITIWLFAPQVRSLVLSVKAMLWG